MIKVEESISKELFEGIGENNPDRSYCKLEVAFYLSNKH
jgi:hypothetical protein